MITIYGEDYEKIINVKILVRIFEKIENCDIDTHIYIFMNDEQVREFFEEDGEEVIQSFLSHPFAAFNHVLNAICLYPYKWVTHENFINNYDYWTYFTILHELRHVLQYHEDMEQFLQLQAVSRLIGLQNEIAYNQFILEKDANLYAELFIEEFLVEGSN